MVEEKEPIVNLTGLTGKSAVVTGGGRGIGYAICERLSEAGAAVIIADSDESSGRLAAESIDAKGGHAVFINCDVTDESRVQEMVAFAVASTGGIDILVNNAGIYPRKPFLETSGDEFRHVVDVNLHGTFLCSRYVAEQMVKRQRGGCLINIASIEAVHPSSTGMSAYDSSKAGVVMLTRSAARELGPHGIRVNAIAPGGILTRGLTSQLGEKPEETQKAQLRELKDFMKRMALGRMGEADDIARVALFLASDLAAYITGEMITVDGGYLVS